MKKSESKDMRLEIRLSPELRATLKVVAKACSPPMSVSAYVRDRLTQAARRDLNRTARGK